MDLMREADHRARRENAEQVTRILLSIGPLSGVEATLIKDNTNASNCVVFHNGAPAPDMPQLNDCSNPSLGNGSPLPAPKRRPVLDPKPEPAAAPAGC